MKKKQHKSGLPPGSVVFTGNQKVDKVVVHYLQFDEKRLSEETFDNHNDLTFHASAEEQIDWYDVRGLHDVKLIEAIGQTFNIHPLILEDVANVNQRPKYEEYERGDFIALKALNFDKTSLEVKTEQVTLYFRDGLVLTFQETESDLFSSFASAFTMAEEKFGKKGLTTLPMQLWTPS
ncbi:MAG: CorA family divalent cation transporter [Bacteroidota bacterium]